MSGTRECQQLHQHYGHPKRRMQGTLFTRHRIIIEHMMVAKDRKVTFREIHTSAVNQAVNTQEVNVVLDDRPTLINNSEKGITRKERATLAQLCRLLGSYKIGIDKDASLNLCADCGGTPHDVKDPFKFPAHPTTLTPSRPEDAIWGLSYIEA